MRVGHGSAYLQVADGSVLGGYAERLATAHGCHDPLEIHAVVLVDGEGHSFALVACDVVCVNSDLARACAGDIRALGVAETWIAAGHTHSGPETGCVPGGGDTPPQWLSHIRGGAVAAVQAGLNNLADANAARYRCMVPGIAGVRSAPPNLIDIPIDVVAVRDELGRPRGLLVTLPVHPTVLPPANAEVSADLVGGVRAYLEDATGGWVVVLTGAAGDISTRHGRQGQTFDEVLRIARLVGDPVLDALSQPGDDLWGPGDRIGYSRRSVAVSPMPLALHERLLAYAGQAMHQVDTPVDARRAATLRLAIEYLDRTVSGPGREVPRSVEVFAVRAGCWVLGAVPGEPFLDSGIDFAARTAGFATMIGYTNGYVGYLPTSDRFSTAGYETLITPYAPGTAERLVDVLVALAQEQLTPVDRVQGRSTILP